MGVLDVAEGEETEAPVDLLESEDRARGPRQTKERQAAPPDPAAATRRGAFEAGQERGGVHGHYWALVGTTCRTNTKGVITPGLHRRRSVRDDAVIAM